MSELNEFVDFTEHSILTVHRLKELVSQGPIGVIEENFSIATDKQSLLLDEEVKHAGGVLPFWIFDIMSSKIKKSSLVDRWVLWAAPNGCIQAIAVKVDHDAINDQILTGVMERFIEYKNAVIGKEKPDFSYRDACRNMIEDLSRR